MSFLLRALAAAGLAVGAASALAADAAALLKAADRYRITDDNVQVEIQIDTTKADGSPDKQRRYLTFAQTGHRSLVLMQSPAERGQKVLMLGDDFWLLMPASQRPSSARLACRRARVDAQPESAARASRTRVDLPGTVAAG